jgi:hypothetical protein
MDMRTLFWRGDLLPEYSVLGAQDDFHPRLKGAHTHMICGGTFCDKIQKKDVKGFLKKGMRIAQVLFEYSTVLFNKEGKVSNEEIKENHLKLIRIFEKKLELEK